MRLFQFWDKDPPPDVLAAIMEWRALPHFSHSLFQLRLARQVMRRHSKRALQAFDRCAYPEMWSDLFRYVALFLYGGAYVDADLAPLPGAGERLSSVTGRGLIRVQPSGEIGTDLLVFPAPGDPLLGRLIEIALGQIEKGTQANLYLVTGPGLVRYFVQKNEPQLMDGIEVMQLDEFSSLMQWPRLAYKAPGKHWSHRMKAGEPIFKEPTDADKDPSP